MTDFCIRCQDEVEYFVSEKYVETSVRGISFGYDRISAKCSVCGCAIYIPKINDLNVDRMEKAFFHKKNEKLLN